MTTTTGQETHAFQTEVRQLLDLMIHSLYSNKEIFLRELISNASDASDKLRFAALSDDGLYEGDSSLEIRLSFDKESRTLTISDAGIGMDHDEVIANLGTIARSGTKEFLSSLSGDQASDAQMIGQFGVGFYSAFIVADRVTVLTRRAGTEESAAIRWSSKGDGEFTIETVSKAQRGTDVILHLREDQDEFIDGWRLKSIIRKFSDHVAWPIMMPIPPEETIPDEEEGEKEAESKADGEGEQKPEWEKINQASALWTRSKSEISDEEYTEFYKHVSHDFDEPLSHIHARLEGNYEYTLLLYIPKRPPFNLWDREQKDGVRLYVRRVFITEGSEDLMPRYLRFIRGVVDSSDLPLNVSREILQQNRVMSAIRKGAVSKVLGLMETLAKDEDESKYNDFWKTFGMVIKEGIIEDAANKDRIAKLLRFSTTHDDVAEQRISLQAYIERMKEGQEAIYYVNAENSAAASSSPHLEIFRRKGIEVLLLTDRVDEWLVTHLNEFDGKPLQSVTKGDLDLSKLGGEEVSDDEEKASESEEKEASSIDGVIERVKGTLGDRIKDVRSSARLTDSPSCLVSDDHDMSASLERILKEAGQDVPATKRILELNPDHPLMQVMEKESDEARFGDWANVLFDQALLGEGGQLEDPAGYVKRLNGLLLALSSK
ncbi:MAG: molecular chaperone HtpG [Magnetococcales bacterium]|nr:molecular chaperone HtpG [Magnetococcales bacterium]